MDKCSSTKIQRRKGSTQSKKHNKKILFIFSFHWSHLNLQKEGINYIFFKSTFQIWVKNFCWKPLAFFFLPFEDFYFFSLCAFSNSWKINHTPLPFNGEMKFSKIPNSSPSRAAHGSAALGGRATKFSSAPNFGCQGRILHHLLTIPVELQELFQQKVTHALQ